MRNLDGVFAELLTNFIAFKRSLGYKYEVEAAELYRFSKFSTTFEIDEPILTKALVKAWCAKRPDEGNSRSLHSILIV